jgi:hypothetical protein
MRINSCAFLVLIPRSLIQFELRFVCDVKYGLSLILLRMDIQLCQQHLLFPLIPLLTKETWVYFWSFNSIPQICMSIHISVSHCFDYCCIEVSFESGKCKSCNSVVLFQDCFGYSGSLAITHNKLIHYGGCIGNTPIYRN